MKIKQNFSITIESLSFHTSESKSLDVKGFNLALDIDDSLSDEEVAVNAEMAKAVLATLSTAISAGLRFVSEETQRREERAHKHEIERIEARTRAEMMKFKQA